jgi:hypothetical protein
MTTTDLQAVALVQFLDVDGAMLCSAPAAHDGEGLRLLASPADVDAAHALRLLDASGVEVGLLPTRAGHDLQRFVGLLQSRLAALP